jgi:hypothetical protein
VSDPRRDISRLFARRIRPAKAPLELLGRGFGFLRARQGLGGSPEASEELLGGRILMLRHSLTVWPRAEHPQCFFSADLIYGSVPQLLGTTFATAYIGPTTYRCADNPFHMGKVSEPVLHGDPLDLCRYEFGVTVEIVSVDA